MPLSKSIFKLLDLVLFPVSLVVLFKFFGLLLAARIQGIDLSIADTVNQLVARPVVTSLSALQFLNSFADLAAFIAVTIGFSWVLVKATKFHNSHISPKLLVTLSNHNLIDLVVSSYVLYHELFIWFVVQALFTLTVLINVLNNSTYPWIGVISLITLILQSIIALQDVYKEIEISKKNLGKSSVWQ